MAALRPASTTKQRSNGAAPQPNEDSSRQVIEGEPSVSGVADLPGLGERLAARAVAALGSESALIAAVESGDVERLAAVPGLGPRRARRLVHAVRGEDPEAFLGTPAAARLFAAVRDGIAARAGTRTARNRLLLIAPLTDPVRRAARFEAARRGARLATTMDVAGARALFARLSPLPPLEPAFEAEVLILADDARDHAALRAAGLHRWAPLADLEDPGVEERMQAAACVVHASRGGAETPDGAPLIPVPFTTDPALLAPWGALARFARIRGGLEAMLSLGELCGTPSMAKEVLDLLALASGAGGTAHGHETGDLEGLAQRILEEELVAAEAALEALTLTGRELVRALAAGDHGMPDAVARVYRSAARRAETRLAEAFGAPVDAYTDSLPPRVDPRGVREAAQAAASDATLRRVAAQLNAARGLVRLVPRFEGELARLVDLDAELALGGFVLEHGLVAPTWGEGLFVEGLLPFQVGPEVERVDYRLGLDADGAATDAVRAALLTGANSGGKTTLLEALALVVAMAHAGLPVPARRAVVPQLDGVHLYRARGERGAGALEALLLELFPLARAPGRHLVLADELEAMTELGAAAEILAALLESLTERGHLAVLATHLAPHLMPALSAATRKRVRVDGIEASGLDAEGNLVVVRSPRLGVLARSTPELILRRLAQTGADGELQAVFAALAERVAQRRDGTP